ncbi:MAG: hypothetical protein AB1801_01610 [Chloroflexota bacterium]
MTLQNRVDPFGNILAVPERGTCMGNRGVLHGDRQNLRRYHQHKHWVICRLDFKGRHRPVMAPGTYTELFFLDEATALAAGHRPCGEYSRGRYEEFRRLWRQAQPEETSNIDNVLHRERFIPYRQVWLEKKRTHPMPIDALPAGTFIVLADDSRPYLVLADTLRPWSFGGYGPAIERPAGRTVVVLTPPSTVRTLAAGYRPQIHPEPYLL